MKIQFFGHAGFRIETGSSVLIIDPFLSGMGKSADDVKKLTENATHILLTHGHGDHIGDTAAIAKNNGDIPVVAMNELVKWLQAKQGVKNTIPFNFGATIPLAPGVSVTCVPAWHTSAADDGTYLGQPAGLVIKAEGKSIYHMGDTCAFLDMQLIGNLHAPDVLLVPIGDAFTMGATEAALACELVANPSLRNPNRKNPVSTIIPIHYATFPMLAQSAEPFIAACKNFTLPTPTVLKPGQALTL